MYLKCYYFCLVLLGVLSVATPVKSEAPETFVVATSQPYESNQTRLMRMIYEDLFARMGVPVKLKQFPLKRLSYEANNGHVDGEVGRIFNYSERFTNMRRVDFPIVQAAFAAFARRSDHIRIGDGWQSLIDTNYSISYQRGSAAVENNLINQVQPRRLESVTEIEQAMQMLKHGRVDVVVHIYGVIADHYLPKPAFKQNTELISMMQIVKLYPHVHKKHAHLIPLMETKLKEMRNEGVLLRYCQQAYGKYAGNHCLYGDENLVQIQW
jgi:hypothetical protein